MQISAGVAVAVIVASGLCFFVAKGPPERQFKLNDGSTIYTWVGGEKTYNLPASTSVDLRPTVGGGLAGTATTYGGRKAAIWCTLEIHADTSGVIRSIRVAQDTIGAWNLSRCAEVLGD